jgi:hypothetical protein
MSSGSDSTIPLESSVPGQWGKTTIWMEMVASDLAGWARWNAATEIEFISSYGPYASDAGSHSHDGDNAFFLQPAEREPVTPAYAGFFEDVTQVNLYRSRPDT